MNLKEVSKCPFKGCGFPIPKKNIRAILHKCLMCGTVICDKCDILGFCTDCYVKHHSVNHVKGYFSDKYEVVA